MYRCDGSQPGMNSTRKKSLDVLLHADIVPDTKRYSMYTASLDPSTITVVYLVLCNFSENY
jgi:hypothetical protein